MPPAAPALRAELLFGASTPAGPVSAEAFAAFLDASVTPRFPAGLTVLEGAGRWRAPDGRLTQEASRVVLVVAPDDAATRAGLEAVRGEYRTRFRQESVGLVMVRGCAAF